MSSDIFKKGYGIVTVAQVAFAFIALFASSFIWNDSNVYIQLGYKGYGWQTLVIVCLLLIWIVNGISLLALLTGKNLFHDYGKLKLLVIYGVCCLLAVAAAGLETWNSKLAYGDAVLHPRFVTAAVFCWLLLISHILTVVIIIFI